MYQELELLPVPVHPEPVALVPTWNTSKMSSKCNKDQHFVFIQWCSWLRMKPDAAPGWCRMCDEPFAISSCYFTAVASYLTAYSVLFYGGFPFPTWRVFISQSVLVLAGLLHAVGMWHGGPDFSKTSISAVLTLLLMLNSTFLTVSASVGPEGWLPFNNRLTCTAVLAIAVFSINLTSACGSVPTHHPTSPHKSIWQPLLNAALDAVRGMDSITDLAMVRIFLDQVRSQSCSHLYNGCHLCRTQVALCSCISKLRASRHPLLNMP